MRRPCPAGSDISPSTGDLSDQVTHPKTSILRFVDKCLLILSDFARAYTF